MQHKDKTDINCMIIELVIDHEHQQCKPSIRLYPAIFTFALAELGIAIHKQISYHMMIKVWETTPWIISIIINLLPTFSEQKLKDGVPTIPALKENHKDKRKPQRCTNWAKI